MNVYSKTTVYLLWALAGLTGAHHFYLHQNKRGMFYASMFLSMSLGILFSSIMNLLGEIETNNVLIFFILGLILCAFWIGDGILLHKTLEKARSKIIPNTTVNFFLKI